MGMAHIITKGGGGGGGGGGGLEPTSLPRNTVAVKIGFVIVGLTSTLLSKSLTLDSLRGWASLKITSGKLKNLISNSL